MECYDSDLMIVNVDVHIKPSCAICKKHSKCTWLYSTQRIESVKDLVHGTTKELHGDADLEDLVCKEFQLEDNAIGIDNEVINSIKKDIKKKLEADRPSVVYETRPSED